MGEPIHTDFSLRVAEALAALPTDFIVKPHPQSIAPNGRHYAEGVAKVSYDKFEDVMDDVDVFVFDVINSTTFWEALCTHKAVVLIFIGTTPIADAVLPLLKRRCVVLEAEYDEAGKPQVDLESLERAVMTSPCPADPSEFQRLLAHNE